MRQKSVLRYDTSSANAWLKDLDSALGSLGVSILFASSPKRSDSKLTDSNRKIAIGIGPRPNEQIDTHSPKTVIQFCITGVSIVQY